MKLIINFIFILIIFIQEALSDDLVITKFNIFSGNKKASYYAVANGICNVFNRHYLHQGFECVAVESNGSAENLKLLATGEADLAVIKSSELNQFSINNAKELQNENNLVARIHDEYLTILVQKDCQINNLSDLTNKIVNIGSIGSTSALVVKEYFNDSLIQPKEIVNFGADKSFKMMCDKKIDAWVYFMGHPNDGFKGVLNQCDLKLISLSQDEVNNFLRIAPFLHKDQLARNYYKNLEDNLNTVSSRTFLSSRINLNPKIVELIKNILVNHKEELLTEGDIFKSFPIGD